MRFVNAPYVHEEQTTRQQWPAASMTWREHRLFSEGWLLHRDATGSRRVRRSRQDAPAGSGSVLLHSPVSLERSHRGFLLPNPADLSSPLPPLPPLPPLVPLRTPAPAAADAPLPQRWEPMRSRKAPPPPCLPVEPWQTAVRSSFPRCTGHHVRVDKAAIAEARASARWAERLAARDA